MAATPYIVEFLYRGRAAGDPTPPAWHVIVAVDDTDGFGQPRHTEQIMNVAEAEAAGFTLPTLIATINADTLTALEAAQAQIVALTPA